MKNRIKRRRPYVRPPRSAEEQAWLDIVPVGREFGSKDYERLSRFEVKVPSKSSRKALAEIAAGKVKSFHSVEDLMADLNGDD